MTALNTHVCIEVSGCSFRVEDIIKREDIFTYVLERRTCRSDIKQGLLFIHTRIKKKLTLQKQNKKVLFL